MKDDPAGARRKGAGPPSGARSDVVNSDILNSDEDLQLTLGYVEEADRPRVAAAYALALELRRVPEAVSEPPIGEIRLQWWRERLDELASGGPPRVGHPTLEALAGAGLVTAAARATLETAIDARARLLYPDPFATPDDFIVAIEAAESSLLLAAPPDAPASALALIRKRIGRYAAARWGKALAPAAWPGIKSALEAAPDRPADASAPSAQGLDPAPFLFVALSKGYLKKDGDQRWPVGKRLALLRAMAIGH